MKTLRSTFKILKNIFYKFKTEDFNFYDFRELFEDNFLCKPVISDSNHAKVIGIRTDPDPTQCTQCVNKQMTV